MRRILAGLLALAAPIATAEPRRGTFHSGALGREVAYTVDVPPAYDRGERVPVLYVLHGLFEGPDFWETRGLASILRSLREAKEVPDFLVVAVDGGRSFFVNGPPGRYEDLVTSDLPAEVEARYHVVAGRPGRALLGVSMGGYAALRIAFAHPEAFSAVAAHSAMLLSSIPTPEQGAFRGQMAAFHAVFGDPIDPRAWAEADPQVWAERADTRAVPRLYFDCGSEDRYGLFAGNERLHRRLEARAIPHEFALHKGDHGYEYVRSVLAESLRFIGRALSGAPGPPPAPR